MENRLVGGGRAGSGDGLHQPTAGAGVVVIILGTTLQQGIDSEGQQAEGPGDEAEPTLKTRTRIDQLAHEAM